MIFCIFNSETIDNPENVFFRILMGLQVTEIDRFGFHSGQNTISLIKRGKKLHHRRYVIFEF